MPQLIKGHVQNNPDYRVSEAKGTPILKFRVQIGDNWHKRQEVVVFGAQAEKNKDLERGEYVILGGDLKENTFNNETKLELVIGWKGNIKRCKDKPKIIPRPPTGVDEDEEEEVVSAPRSYRRRSDADEQETDEFVMPDLDDCPDWEFPDPTDEDYKVVRDMKYAEFVEWGFTDERHE
jgi:hypothetical protein